MGRNPARGRRTGGRQAIFYRAPDGREPVAEYVRAQPIEKQVMLNNQIGRLNELTDDLPHLPFPWSSQVRGELRELRCQAGGERHRILFARSRGLFILLHAFRKNSRKLPDEEIRIAELRWDDYVARMSADPRRGPRPAGHDAPHRRRGRKGSGGKGSDGDGNGGRAGRHRRR